MEIEGNVFNKKEVISNGNASEDHVYWIGAHVFVHEDKNVDGVKDDAKYTNNKSNPTMKWKISILRKTMLNLKYFFLCTLM